MPAARVWAGSLGRMKHIHSFILAWVQLRNTYWLPPMCHCGKHWGHTPYLCRLYFPLWGESQTRQGKSIFSACRTWIWAVNPRFEPERGRRCAHAGGNGRDYSGSISLLPLWSPVKGDSVGFCPQPPTSPFHCPLWVNVLFFVGCFQSKECPDTVCPSVDCFCILSYP